MTKLTFLTRSVQKLKNKIEFSLSRLKIRKYEFLIVLGILILPFLWYMPGYFIAKGDSFPYLFDSTNIQYDLYLWTDNSLGNPSPNASFSCYGLLFGLLNFLFNSIGLTQIIFYSLFFLISTLSMQYLVHIVYPKKKQAKIVAGLFYIFNIFLLQTLWNIGMIVTYAFLPLLLALLIKLLTTKQNIIKQSIIFGLVFSITASISSMNVANIALILIALSFVSFYYIIFERRIEFKYILTNIGFLTVFVLLFSIWWIIPIINHYLLSATQFQNELNVLSWSFTHNRASFMNLFMLNGNWGFRPEYFPYYNVYSETIFASLLFVPIILASLSLFFKNGKIKLNSYLLLIVVILLFLAKGLHEPLSFVNLFLYNSIPFMNMFREPVSKFTMLMIPFIALLIGFSINEISDKISHFPNSTIKSGSKLFSIVFALIFIICAFPLIVNPIETKTEQVPFSSYVKIPQYYYDASEWLDEKQDNYNLLVTPLDKYYQVAYSWGYYGSDSFLERVFNKPLISPCYDYSYKLNSDIVELMDQIDATIKNNNKPQFEILLQLLNIKYILVRSDLDLEYLSANGFYPLSNGTLATFLVDQPNIIHVAKFGLLDMYEYTNELSSVHILKNDRNEKYELDFKLNEISSEIWNFNSEEQIEDWKLSLNDLLINEESNIKFEDFSLRFKCESSNNLWNILRFPSFNSTYLSENHLSFDIRGDNAHDVHVKVVEKDQNHEILYSEYLLYLKDGRFDWTSVDLIYQPEIENTTFIEFQIWVGQNIGDNTGMVWLDNIKLVNFFKELNFTHINHVLMRDFDQAMITSLNKLSPTRIAITVNSSAPFLLTINEAYDSGWKAHTNLNRYDSVSIFSIINGFYIDDYGEHLEVIIEYEPQTYFEIGIVISLITLIVCFGFLIYKKVGKNTGV